MGTKKQPSSAIRGTYRELSGYIEYTATAGDNATTKIESSVSLEEKIGMRIRCIEYFIASGVTATTDKLIEDMTASGDSIRWGFSFLSTQPTTGFLVTSPGVIDFNSIARFDTGTAANSHFIKDPAIIRDMTLRYPDGLLIHPANLYKWFRVEDTLNAAGKIGFKMFYTIEEINQDTWDDLWKQMFVTQAS